MSIPGVIVRGGSLITPGGDQGVPGTPSEVPGPQGDNAYTLTAGDLIVPDVGASADLSVEDSDWIAVGQMVYLADGAGPGEALGLKVTAKDGNVVTVWRPGGSAGVDIPLASPNSDGLMRQVSGLTTDFVNGTNSCTNLVNALTGAYLPLSGGTLTGNLNLSNHDLSGVRNATTTNVTANTLTCPNLYFRSDLWRLQFDGSNGNLIYYDSGSTVKFYWNNPSSQLWSSGSIYALSYITAAGAITGANLTSNDFLRTYGVIWCGSTGTSILYCGKIVWANSGWNLYFQPSNGDLIYYRYDGTWLLWYDNAGAYFRIQTSIQANGEIYAYGVLKASGASGLMTLYGGSHGMVFHWNGAGVYVMVDNATGWMVITDPSDERLKEDITPSTFDCLGTVLRLPVHQFRWKPTRRDEESPVRDLGDKRTRIQADGRAPMIPIGFVAQRLHQVFPEAVMRGDDGEIEPRQRFNWSVDKNTMLATLTGAIQQLCAKVDALETRVAQLEGTSA